MTAMDPNKRGNPPFEPSSYAAGLERRVKRAEAATRWLLDGTEHEKQFAEQWWRDHFKQPEVVLSDPRPAQGTPTRRAETTGSVGEADGGPVAEGHAPEPCVASPNPTTQGESK